MRTIACWNVGVYFNDMLSIFTSKSKSSDRHSSNRTRQHSVPKSIYICIFTFETPRMLTGVRMECRANDVYPRNVYYKSVRYIDENTQDIMSHIIYHYGTSQICSSRSTFNPQWIEIEIFPGQLAPSIAERVFKQKLISLMDFMLKIVQDKVCRDRYNFARPTFTKNILILLLRIPVIWWESANYYY